MPLMNVTLELWCIVSGDSSPFPVSVSTHDNTSALKERIYEQNKNGVLRGIDANDLDLWKVSSFYQFLRFFIVRSNSAVVAYSLMFSSQAPNLDFPSHEPLSRLGMADLGINPKLLRDYEHLNEHWAVQPESCRLHVLVIKPPGE
jgi:Crinkler effector protein N-terminal domain